MCWSWMNNIHSITTYIVASQKTTGWSIYSRQSFSRCLIHGGKTGLSIYSHQSSSRCEFMGVNSFQSKPIEWGHLFVICCMSWHHVHSCGLKYLICHTIEVDGIEFIEGFTTFEESESSCQKMQYVFYFPMGAVYLIPSSFYVISHKLMHVLRSTSLIKQC